MSQRIPDQALDLERYAPQVLYEAVGIEGQKRLAGSRVTLIGCGALGGVLAGTLSRAGVGFLRVVDRDFLELSNLQRQSLFDEHDVAEGLPKAEAAARKLRGINSSITVEPVVADVNASNAETLCGDVDLLLDGTDNLETRFLINDVSVRHRVPWVFGACIGAEGQTMAVLPHDTPCLRCIWDTPPAPGTMPTCDTVGVLAPAVNIVASLQATEALKILLGRPQEVVRGLTTVDVWRGVLRRISVQGARDEGNCVCCRQGRYEFLSGSRASTATTLCGRNAVQVLPFPAGQVSFDAIARRLPPSAGATANAFMLRFGVEGCRVTLFGDGRAIVQGTADPAVARGIYARYVGV